METIKTTKTKPTPGPWSACRVEVEQEQMDLFAVRAGRKPVALHVLRPADALLIAAAPLYFAACEGPDGEMGLTRLEWLAALLVDAADPDALRRAIEEDAAAVFEAVNQVRALLTDLRAAHAAANS